MYVTVDLAASLLVFATSNLSTGALGGLSGADSICATEAAAVGLSMLRTYRALLSYSTVSAFERVLSGIAFANANHSMLAHNRSELFSGSLLAPVLTLGGVVPSIGPHTGTNSDGSWSGGNCADWTDEGMFAYETVGGADYMSSTWLAGSLCPCCQEQRPILCVQGKS
jgi:hypothetical protein